MLGCPPSFCRKPLFREAAGAVLGKVRLLDLSEFGAAGSQAAAGIADRVAWAEGTVVGFPGKVGRDAGDGIEGFAALVGGGDALEESASVGVLSLIHI